MGMLILEGNTNELRSYFDQVLNDLAGVAELGYGVVNDVTDPDTGFRYFFAVDSGRGPAVAGQGPFSKGTAKTLVFRTEGGAGEKVFPKFVPGSSPRRIVDRAQEVVPDVYSAAIRGVLEESAGFPTKLILETALVASEAAVLEAWSESAVEQTTFQRTRAANPDKEETAGLEDAFRIVPLTG